MYLDFYGLSKKPFHLTPDPQFLFLSKDHREALNHMLYGIQEKECFIAITGDIGTGKTMLCLELLETVNDQEKIVILLNPLQCQKLFPSYMKLSQEISTRDMLDSFHNFLVNELQKGRRVVLIIDEAQNLSPDMLEQIRIFSNFEMRNGHHCQIILVGQLELMEKLASRELRALDQRISVRYKLNPLNRKEIEDYIAYRMKVAGADGKITFASSALTCIYRHSAGIPRLVNLLCDRTLLSGYINKTHYISKKIVSQGMKSLEGRG